MKVAPAAANAPYQRVKGPLVATLLAKMEMPSLPLVCMVVLRVSIGVSRILNDAEAALAPNVLTAIGSFAVDSLDSNNARSPTLAAVSLL